MKEKVIYALGFFDGVHLGHQALLRRCGELAQAMHCTPGAITFTAHPDALITGSAPPLINTAADRLLLLRRFGVEKVVELPFDNDMMTMPWQDFFALLIRNLGAAGLVCGHDFRFGYRGEGDPALLQQACRTAGIPCAVIPEQTLDGVAISSTYIRSLLEAGQLEQAVRFLGHPHILTGTVITGRQLGRTLGIPTANLALPPEVVEPKHGVYACKAVVDGQTYLAVTNVGSRPTVGGHHVTVEPWLLDFEGDLYGRELTLELHAFLRTEQKFASLVQLQAEIQKNAAQTRKLLEKT